MILQLAKDKGDDGRDDDEQGGIEPRRTKAYVDEGRCNTVRTMSAPTNPNRA